MECTLVNEGVTNYLMLEQHYNRVISKYNPKNELTTTCTMYEQSNRLALFQHTPDEFNAMIRTTNIKQKSSGLLSISIGSQH